MFNVFAAPFLRGTLISRILLNANVAKIISLANISDNKVSLEGNKPGVLKRRCLQYNLSTTT